nr:hypothetical protein [Rhodococcus sp. UFZ-B548]
MVIDDCNQIPQQVRITQGMRQLRVRVVRGPRIVHGDTGECGQDPGSVHRFAATPPMAGDQRQQ